MQGPDPETDIEIGNIIIIILTLLLFQIYYA